MSQALERGIKTMTLLSSKKSLGVTELADLLEVNKSSAFRILESLQKFNFVEQDNVTSKYKLGPAVLKLSEQVYKNLNIISTAKPLMGKLAEEIKESVHLCKLSNDNAVIIEQIMVNSRLVVNARIGNMEPLHCSAVGKCLIAFADDIMKESIISRLNYERFTEKTITTKEELKSELRSVEDKGYAVDDCELSEEIKCIAAPIFNHLGEAKYSLGVSVPTTRMNNYKLEELAVKLKRVADVISSQLGYQKID